MAGNGGVERGTDRKAGRKLVAPSGEALPAQAALFCEERFESK